MRLGTRFFAASVVVGGLSLPLTVPASAQTSPNPGRTDSALTASLARAAMQPAQVRAIHDLFARATDLALLPNGVTGLQSMIVPQAQMPPTTQPASNVPTAPPSGTNGGVAGTTESQRTTSQASRTARALNLQGVKRNGAIDSRQLNQLVQQIRQQWRAKYKQDLRAGNEAKVYADITAADLRGQPQTAGSRIAANPTTRPANQSPLGTQNSEPIDVTVPAVSDTKPLQVQVVPGPGETFQFSSATPVDSRQLSQNVLKELKAFESQQSHWPADVNEAYRLVSQHVLTAIADSTAGPERNATPAAEQQSGSGASQVRGIRGTP